MKHDQTVILSVSDVKAYADNALALDRVAGQTPYRYAVAWAKALGLTPVSLQATLAQAVADSAPVDAMQKLDGEWVLFSQVMNEHTRDALSRLL